MHHLLRERMRLLPFTALLCALCLLMVACAPAHRKTTPDAGLELRLLHVNDTHAFLAGIDDRMNACFEAADCRGGLARISAAIQTARQEQDNVIALDAGDQFQGTLFYSVNKWPVIAAADALLPYDAMTLGNHEFDNGVEALAQMLTPAKFDIVSANYDVNNTPLNTLVKPYVIKEIDGVKCEPIEELTISVPEEFSSKMIDMVTRRKGEMVSMETQGDRVNIEFDMPSRGIIGLRTNVLTASQGEAIMAHRFKEYQPYKGDIPRRTNGSMIAMESGTAFAYAIDKLQYRGKFFIYPQDEVYAGQVVGEHVHENDLVINVTKSKKLTNMRASGSDDKARIIPPVIFSLEEALEYIKEDEYVEVTPKSMRMRKVILDELERKRANKNA
mgnify:CR=1 FL=1